MEIMIASNDVATNSARMSVDGYSGITFSVTWKVSVLSLSSLPEVSLIVRL